ncbi:hypothetical protein DL769_003200 [Monosporascus sp. CRB-8-3]|nr:hypothetical protein DL769_003200 [Monosporascus sp. CRB-8-3]
MITNRATTKYLLVAIIVAFGFAIPLQEREDSSNNRAPPPHISLSSTSACGSVVPLQERQDISAHRAPPPSITYVTRSYYTIRSAVASETLPCRPNGLTSLDDAEKAADGTLLSDRALHEPPPDGEFTVLEENDGAAEQFTVADGTCNNRYRMGRTSDRDDDSILARRDNTTAGATPSTVIKFLTYCRSNSNSNNQNGYNNYNFNNTYNDGTTRRDSRHRNIGPTTALIGSAPSAAATTTIVYPVDGELDPDLRAHIDHRRADNHDWQQ